MAVPTIITLTGDYGAASTGTVVVERQVPLTFDGTVYPALAVAVPLVAGAFSLAVYATDDAGVDPENAYYKITERVNGRRTQKNIFVPFDSAGATLDVNTAEAVSVLPVSPPVIPNLGITTAKIADLAVTTGKIADDAVTPAKLDRAYVEAAGIGDRILVSRTYLPGVGSQTVIWTGGTETVVGTSLAVVAGEVVVNTAGIYAGYVYVDYAYDVGTYRYVGWSGSVGSFGLSDIKPPMASPSTTIFSFGATDYIDPCTISLSVDQDSGNNVEITAQLSMVRIG